MNISTKETVGQSYFDLYSGCENKLFNQLKEAGFEPKKRRIFDNFCGIEVYVEIRRGAKGRAKAEKMILI